jgi:hypothetical protein
MRAFVARTLSGVDSLVMEERPAPGPLAPKRRGRGDRLRGLARKGGRSRGADLHMGKIVIAFN